MQKAGSAKEKAEGLVVVRETATDMVCIRLVNRKVAVHRWPRLKVSSSSFTSTLTSLSMASSSFWMNRKYW